MPKRSRKSTEPRSLNDVVFDIVQSFASAGQSPGKERPQKNAAAVAREKLSDRRERKARAASSHQSREPPSGNRQRRHGGAKPNPFHCLRRGAGGAENTGHSSS